MGIQMNHQIFEGMLFLFDIEPQHRCSKFRPLIHSTFFCFCCSATLAPEEGALVGFELFSILDGGNHFANKPTDKFKFD